jgi:hypothetical protein
LRPIRAANKDHSKTRRKVDIRRWESSESANIVDVSPENEHDLALLKVPLDSAPPLPWKEFISGPTPVTLHGFPEIVVKKKMQPGPYTTIPDDAKSQGVVSGWQINNIKIAKVLGNRPVTELSAAIFHPSW